MVRIKGELYVSSSFMIGLSVIVSELVMRGYDVVTEDDW